MPGDFVSEQGVGSWGTCVIYAVITQFESWATLEDGLARVLKSDTALIRSVSWKLTPSPSPPYYSSQVFDLKCIWYYHLGLMRAWHGSFVVKY